MKTWIKRISIALAVVIAIAVAGLAVFLLTFDPNAYKDRLEAWVQQRYHRTLTIEGDIEATLFPSLGLTLQGVSLSEPGSTETFASVENARMAVAIWPLLSRNVVVDHATFSGVKARVVRDKQGHLNFQDLLGAAKASDGHGGADTPSDDAPGAGTPYIDIAGLDIKDGEVLLQDDATGRALTISQLSARTGRVRVAEPFALSVSAHIEGSVPRFNADISGQGELRVDPDARRYAARKLDVKVAGQLPGVQAKNLAVRGDIAFDEGRGALDVTGLTAVFQGELARLAGGPASMDASVAAQRLQLDRTGGALQVEKLAVRAKGTAVPGPFELAVDVPSLDLSPNAAAGAPMTARLRVAGNDGMDVRLGVKGIGGNTGSLSATEATMAGEIKQGARAWTFSAASPMTLVPAKREVAATALAGEVAINDPGLPGGALKIPYTGAAQADRSANTANIRLEAQLEGGKLALTADVTRMAAQPDIRFALAADTLDLDKLMPADTPAQRATPAAAAAKDGGTRAAVPGTGPAPAPTTAPAPAPATGPAPAPAAASDPAAAPSAGTAAPAAPSAVPAPTPRTPDAARRLDGGLDLSALVGPAAQGTVKIGRLVARGVVAENLSGAVRLARGKLDVSPLAATLYGGKLAGNVSLDAARDNAIATRFTLDGVAIGPLLAALAERAPITGVGNVAADLTTRGRQGGAFRDNLGGTLQLRLRDGAIKGFDVARTLRDLKQAILGGKQGDVADTNADSSRETTFSRMDADLALAAGIATIKRLDVVSPVVRVSQGTPAVIDLPKGTLDLVANVRIADPPPAYADLGELRGLAVPVHVAGPYDALRYRVDWRAVAGDALSRALQRALRDRGADSKGNGESRQDAIKDLGRMLKGITGK
jgi:AsmA protein